MKLKTITFANVLGILAASVFLHTTTLADDQTETPSGSSTVTPDTRYGLFNGLDHRSWYSEGDFPEPFLVDDSGLEINEARLDWLHTTAGSQHNNTVTAEVEKGFGLLTLEIEVPFR